MMTWRSRRIHQAMVSVLATILILCSLLPISEAQAQGYQPPAQLPVPRFERSRCPFYVPPTLWVTCGYLTVLEDHHQPEGPTIRLAVAIAHTPSANPAPDPVLYLSGGPGSAALPSTVTFARAWAPFLANRDLVVVDQRGTGFSQPSLVCPESDRVAVSLLGQRVSRAAKVQAEEAAMLHCHDRLAAQGVNFANYTSAASAADLDDLRRMLGYNQWNIFGISYGTRLALTAMRDYPDGIRSVVLDSVYPPQADLYTEMPANLNRALQTLFNGCAEDRLCNAAYPDLQNVFSALISQLDADPATIQVRNPTTGALISIQVDGSELISVLFHSLYRATLIPQLPKMLVDTRAGRYGLLANLEANKLSSSAGTSIGMYFAVQCSEEIPFSTPWQTMASVWMYPQLQTFFAGIIENTDSIFQLCANLGVSQPDPIENQPVYSDIPTLILSGEYDPITPPRWAENTAEYLSNSSIYVFSGTGHAVVARGACPMRLIHAFLNAPLGPQDALCVVAMGEPRFW